MVLSFPYIHYLYPSSVSTQSCAFFVSHSWFYVLSDSWYRLRFHALAHFSLASPFFPLSTSLLPCPIKPGFRYIEHHSPSPYVTAMALNPAYSFNYVFYFYFYFIIIISSGLSISYHINCGI